MEYLNVLSSELYKIVFILVPVLVSVALIVWLDRRIWGAVQKRKGPNVVGPFGLLQTLADALKYIFKEIIIPASSNKVIFILAPIVTMTLALVAWAVIPFSNKLVLADINVGILYIFAVSSLSIYGVIMAGWASNSKYAFLGALRSTAQMVSYEVSIGLVIVCVLLCVGSLNLQEIVMAQKNCWFLIPLFPMFIVFIISALAETNRAPFDLPEDESALVAGYFTEDYYYDSSGDLDEHNGRFCKTPEYTQGIYAYFATVDNLITPQFPYYIGHTYRGFPIEENIQVGSKIKQSNFNFENSELVRNTNPYNMFGSGVSYDYVVQPYKSINNVAFPERILSG